MYGTLTPNIIPPIPQRNPNNIAEKIASLGEDEIISNNSGITIRAHVIGNIIIATVTCTNHQASHERGFIYFIPKPKVP